MSKLKDYWTEDDPEISETTRSILTKWSGLNEDELVKHIRDIVRQVWNVIGTNSDTFAA